MIRPKLNKVPFPDYKKPELIITCNIGQWDILLDDGYKQGATILELDDNENPIAAYKKEITI